MYLLTASCIYYKLFSKYIETELSGLVRYRSLEGSLKYSIFNILSTFFLLFGSILLFAFSKASFFFSTLAIVLGKLSVASSFGVGESPVWLLGGLFIGLRSEEHTSELQSLMRISYAVFCLKKKKKYKSATKENMK